MIIVPTMWEEHQMPHDYYRFTRYGIKRLLEEAGFAVIRSARWAATSGSWAANSSMFWNSSSASRARLLWPFLAIPFGFVLPILCTHLDWLDRDKYYTIGQLCFCRRVRDPGALNGPGDGILP